MMFNGPLLKDNSVKLVDNTYNANDVLKPISADIGKENIMGCVKSQGQWIVTLKRKEDVQLLQQTGIKVNDDYVTISGVTTTLLTVSLFGVPSYMDDYDLSCKLQEYGCKLKSKWTHKCHEDYPDIENGIRYVRLEMPSNAKSLPYAITVNRERIRLKHNGQLRVCNLCLAEDHIMRECPKFQCRECGVQGHTAFRCPQVKCFRCGKNGHKSYHCEEMEFGRDKQEHDSMDVEPKTDGVAMAPTDVPGPVAAAPGRVDDQGDSEMPQDRFEEDSDKEMTDSTVTEGEKKSPDADAAAIEIDNAQTKASNPSQEAHDNLNEASAWVDDLHPRSPTLTQIQRIKDLKKKTTNRLAMPSHDLTNLRRAASSDGIYLKSRRSSSSKGPNLSVARKTTPKDRPVKM